MLSLLLLIASVQGVTQITKFYSQDLTCSKQETLWYITQPATCTPSATCTNLNGQTASRVECPSVTNFPSGWSFIEVWASSSTCSGVSSAFVAAPSNTCSGIWTSATIMLACGTGTTGVGSILDALQSTASCGGATSKTATKGGNCQTGNPTTSFSIASYKWTCPISTTVATTSGPTTSPAKADFITPCLVLALIWLLL